MKPDDIIETTKDIFVTENTIKKTVPPNDILVVMKERKATGEIHIEVNDGGVRNITVREKTKIPAAQAEAVRNVLGMDDDESESV